MGYNLRETITILDDMYDLGCINSPLLSLGDQEFKEEPEDIREFAKENGYQGLLKSFKPSDIYKDRYNIEHFSDIDINGKANITIDFTNSNQCKHLRERFNTIVDLGTIEHTFDQTSAFRNVYNMCKVNGHILHVLPYISAEHGLFNYSARTFHKINMMNPHLELVREGILIQPFKNPGKYIIFENNIHVDNKVKRIKKLSEHLNINTLNLWHVICFKKLYRDEFRTFHIL